MEMYEESLSWAYKSAGFLEPMLRKIVHQELTQIVDKQEDRFLSPKEVCERFIPKLSKTKLASWTEQRLLQEYRLGGRVFYLFSEIVEKAKTLKRHKR
jgi:hypothetical protein